ncbi:hypothetical protein [Stigmatella hybrida]|uniref:hypothetical protein n=1 Tax=Stigmatella hybrida TaxID=394097 RepID=UPI001CDA9234|nr:hypothetical protein [Stigmatella hybrida]
MSCCIQKNPLTPAASCGASAQDIAEALTGAKALHQAAKMEEAASADATREQEDDFANNAHLPEWKQECIRNYVACQNETDWQGPCYDCLRRCEGQQDWPFGMCWPLGKKEK